MCGRQAFSRYSRCTQASQWVIGNRLDHLTASWTLILRPCDERAIQATLTDSSWSTWEGVLGGSQVGRPFWPHAIRQGLSRLGGTRLRLQLPMLLDATDWESHLAPLMPAAAIIPRFLTDLPNSEGAADLPATRHVVGVADDSARLSFAQAARRSRRPVAMLSGEFARWRLELLNRAIGARWSETMPMSLALEASLRTVGIPIGACRLYGDGLAPVGGLGKERRPVTAVHIDLAGSTKLQQGIGNEAYSERHRKFQACCREVVSRLQGSFDQRQGDDACMAYFGFPRAVEDGAARALLAAREIAHQLDGLGLRAHIGVASGMVAVSANQPFADELNLAARLAQLGRADEILVAASTLARAPASFRMRLDLSRQVPDFPGQPVYVLDQGGPPGGERVRPHGADLLVGRSAELAKLEQAWTRAKQGRLQRLTIEGEAGVGKSRLLAEFARTLEERGEPGLMVVGDAHTIHSPFAAVVDALRELFAIGGDLESTVIQARIAPRLIGVLDDPGELRDLSELLSPVRTELGETVRASPRWRELLLKCLAAFTARGPCWLIVDDAHWLDPSSHDLLAGLTAVCEGSALLVLMGHRTDVFSGDRKADDPELIALRGLSPSESEQLAKQIAADLPDEVRRKMVERSGGLPLYLEESLRAIQRRGGDANLPPRLEHLLAVRLEELGPDRAVAQILSLLGRELTAADAHALLAIDDPYVEAARGSGSVRSLLRSGLVESLEGPVVRYRFKHALIRDAAYWSLWEDDRARLHGACADLMARGTPEARQQRPELLAFHLQRAGRLLEALHAWQSAARLASTRHAHRECLELCAEGLKLCDMLSVDAKVEAVRTQLHLLEASAHMALEGYGSAQVEAAYRAAQASAARGGDSAKMLRLKLGLEACFVARGDLVMAAALAAEVVQATRWEVDPRLALQARWAAANVQFHQGHWQAALAGFDECLAHYQLSMHSPTAVQDPAIMCLGYSSWIAFEIGQADDAMQRIGRLLDLARQLDHPYCTAVALGFAASVTRLCGDSEAAAPHAEEAVRVCERGGFHMWLAHAWMVHGQVLMDLGEFDAGREQIERGYRQWSNASRLSCGTYLATHAEILMRHGRTGEARPLLDEAWRTTEAIGEHHYRAEIARLRGLCHWQQGDLAPASTELMMARDEAGRHSRVGLELRCALGLGALLAAQGRFEEATSQLETLMTHLPRHSRSRDVRWAAGALTSWRERKMFKSARHVPWEPL